MKKQIWQKRTFKQVLGVMTALLMLVMAAVPAFGDESLSQSGEGNPAELEIGDEGAAAEADIFSTEPVPETEPSVTEPKYWEGGGGFPTT
ncbi:hypothetical protein AGMMS49983_07810 [Clostridia bacterium]|nr:hypothetical protein AGMMS49983_07810 [Clostridia bacterium]